MEVQVEEARGDPAAGQIHAPGVRGARLAGTQLARDPIPREEQAAGQRCVRLGIEQARVVQDDPHHDRRVYPRDRLKPAPEPTEL